MKCKFDIAWVGRCKKEANESGFCEEHESKKCCSCGAQATHSCAETFQFVCGALLCDNCEHEIAPNGTNGAIYRHCKKTEQKYTPWYARRENRESFL